MSKSSNQYEAEVALRKANELMEKYQLTHADLIPEQSVGHSELTKNIAQHFIWAKDLASACADLFDCTTINYTQDKSWVFVGEKTSILCAQAMFYHLFKAWKDTCSRDFKQAQPYNRKLFRKSHGVGFTYMIWEKVNELTEARRNNIMASTGKDLVVVSNAQIDDYIASNFKLRKVTARDITISDDGYYQGVVAGSKINLSQPIEESDNDRRSIPTTSG